MKKYDHLERVAVESPFGAPTQDIINENISYAKACVNDCLKRGEAPYASHLFFTQEGLLDDNDPDERMLGIMAGKEWEKAAVRTAVYVDRGISSGMKLGIEICKDIGRPIVYRSLGDRWQTADGEKAIEELSLNGETVFISVR